MTLPIANTFASKFSLELKVMITKWYPYYKIHENRAVVGGEASWGGGGNLVGERMQMKTQTKNRKPTLQIGADHTTQSLKKTKGTDKIVNMEIHDLRR